MCRKTCRPQLWLGGGSVCPSLAAKDCRAISKSMVTNSQPPGRKPGGFLQTEELYMKKSTLIFCTLLLLSACANPRSTTNQLELGMSREQVRTIMGEPDSSAAQEKGDCYFYSMWRDFWNRRPGNYSDRYYTCFQQGKLVTYGRVGDPL